MDLLLSDRMDSIAGSNSIRVIEYTAVNEDEKPSHKQTDKDLYCLRALPESPSPGQSHAGREERITRSEPVIHRI